jgi:hypothetical protein
LTTTIFGLPPVSRSSAPPLSSSLSTGVPRYRRVRSPLVLRCPVCGLSTHFVPWQYGEKRPNHGGPHGEIHKYHPELSGAPSPPNHSKPSSPSLNVSLHPMGGLSSVVLCTGRRCDCDARLPHVQSTAKCVATHPVRLLLRYQGSVHSAKSCPSQDRSRLK